MQCHGERQMPKRLRKADKNDIFCVFCNQHAVAREGAAIDGERGHDSQGFTAHW